MISYKYFVILSAVLVASTYVDADVTFDTSNIANGEYSYKFDNGGYSKEESGKVDSEGNSIITGEYRYDLGGKEYVVSYVADKDGYHPMLTILDYQGQTGQQLPPALGGPPALVASLLG